MDQTKKVLLIEDDQVDQLAFKRLVKKQELPYNYTIAASIAEAKQVLADQDFDVVVMDYHLGDGNSFEILKLLDPQKVPIIFATGAGDEETAVKAMKSGAYDYLIKDSERHYLKMLPVTVETAIQRKRTADRIQMLSQAVMSTTDSIYITDMQGQIIFVNKAFSQTYGHTQQEIIGQSETGLHDALPASQESGPAQPPVEESDLYHRRQDGSRFPVSVSRSEVQDSQGQNIARVVVARDITAQKRVEEELRDLNASKDKFFSIISHDLKGPFTHLLGYTEILNDEIEALSRKEIQEFAQTIHRVSKNLANLLDNLLEWARLQMRRIEYRPEVTDLNQIIASNLDLLKDQATQKSITVEVELAADRFANIDQFMINSVVQNLISNAIKFTHPAGRIRVTTQPQDKAIQVRVSDTGVGINKKDMAKLFRIDQHYTTFGTANERGTGLGLILCKEFVERHGGHIQVESSPDQGTTFSFTVPKP